MPKGVYPRKKGRKISAETRAKLSIAKKGKNNPMFGKRFSPETCRKMSEARMGHPVSQETRNKISESRKGIKPWIYGKHMSEEHKRKRNYLLGKP